MKVLSKERIFYVILFLTLTCLLIIGDSSLLVDEPIIGEH